MSVSQLLEALERKDMITVEWLFRRHGEYLQKDVEDLLKNTSDPQTRERLLSYYRIQDLIPPIRRYGAIIDPRSIR